MPALSDEVVSNSSSSLGLCGNSRVGDASPLFVYEPAFTVANVSQSSAFPCATNRISIVLRTNVPFCAKDCNAQITLSNLVGAVATDGDIRLSSPADEERDTFFEYYVDDENAARERQE